MEEKPAVKKTVKKTTPKTIKSVSETDEIKDLKKQIKALEKEVAEKRLEDLERQLKASLKETGIMVSVAYPIDDKVITLGIESSTNDDLTDGHEKLFLELMSSMMNIANMMSEE